MNFRSPTITLLAAIAAAALLPAAAAEATLVTPHEASPQVVTPHAVTAPSAPSTPGPQSVAAPVTKAASAPAYVPSAASGFSAPASAAPGGSHAPSLPGTWQQAIDTTPKKATEQERLSIRRMRDLELFDWTAELKAITVIHDVVELLVGPINLDIPTPETLVDRVVVPEWGTIVPVPGGQRPGPHLKAAAAGATSVPGSIGSGTSSSSGGKADSSSPAGPTPGNSGSDSQPGSDGEGTGSGAKPNQVDEPGSSKK